MKKKPNIVFIMADDLGSWALGCAGNDEIKTPNIDRLAENGMRFDNFFCVSPVCSPARASLLTGTIPSAHGIHDWLVSGNIDASRAGKEWIDIAAYEGVYEYVAYDKPISYLDGMLTYTDVMSQNGYNCAFSGKWHLGDSATPQHGFKHWSSVAGGWCNYYHPDYCVDGKIDIKHGHYVTDLITSNALSFLDEISILSDPFYLSVHYTAPHSPWEADQHPPEYINMYENCVFESIPDIPDHPDFKYGPIYNTPNRKKNLTGYFAATTAMDKNIGRLLDYLEKNNLMENTIIIFTSDNGMNMGHHGIWGKGSCTCPLNMYDYSVKVPFIVCYPAMIRKGTVTDSLVSAYDLFPTFMELLDIELPECHRMPEYHKMPECHRMPGKSFVPVLRGEADNNNQVVVYDEYGPVRMIRTKDKKYIHRYPGGPNEFYDLVNDPDEEKNLVNDPTFKTEIMDLQKELEKWFANYIEPNKDGKNFPVTGEGQVGLNKFI